MENINENVIQQAPHNAGPAIAGGNEEARPPQVHPLLHILGEPQLGLQQAAAQNLEVPVHPQPQMLNGNGQGTAAFATQGTDTSTSPTIHQLLQFQNAVQQQSLQNQEMMRLLLSSISSFAPLLHAQSIPSAICFIQQQDTFLVTQR